MTLSIIIVFCDKDYQNIPKLLSQIENRVKIPHEVITISNCEYRTPNFTPTYAFGKNMYQMAARKKAVEYITGDYVWFVDGDDEILDINEDIDLSADLNIFSFSCVDSVQTYDEEWLDSFKILDFYSAYGNMLWNKIFKADTVKKAFEHIPADKQIVANEDGCIYLACLYNIKTVHIQSRVIYRQSIGFSNREYIESFEIFNHMLTGWRECQKIMASFVEPDILEMVEKWQFWFYMKNILISDNSLLEQEMDVIESLYSHDFINKEWLDNIINLKGARKVYWYLKRKYPDEEWDCIRIGTGIRFNGKEFEEFEFEYKTSPDFDPYIDEE